MRTTLDLPDDLYRLLKMRAASAGVPLRRLVKDLLEQGLRSGTQELPERIGRREPPPLILPGRGVPIAAITRKSTRQLEDSEDQSKSARSS